MSRLNFDSEELLHWWEPKTDLSFIFDFDWKSIHHMKDAVTYYLSARLHAVSQRATRGIMEDGCPQLKRMMASNPQTSPELLDFLSCVSDEAALVRIAENPNTSRETLSVLAFHNDAEVRCAVADNINTPDTCFKRLAMDESSDVRYRVAENPSAPLASLYAVLKDENPYVSQRAKRTLSRILLNSIAEVCVPLSQSTNEVSAHSEETQRIEDGKTIIAELNEICGYDFMAVEFPTYQNAL